MTLIVSVVTNDIVFQISDRRVTLEYPDGRREIREEPLTKAVVYCDRAVFGFTGYAEVETRRSDLWIAEQLNDVVDLGDGFAKIRSRLTEVFRRPRYTGGHTVTAAGFKREPDGSLRPYYAMVSNQFEDGTWLAKPTPDFRWLVELAPENAVGVFAAPWWLDGEPLNALRAGVSGATSLDEAVALVVDAIRAVASAHDEVGSDLLLSVLPRASVGRDEVMLLTGGPPGETPTFHYLPSDGDPVQYGPTFVCGGSIMSGLTVKPLDDVDREQSERETREFRRANRPQHAYIVEVATERDASGRVTRAPATGPLSTGGSNYYHPSEDLALVLTRDELRGHREITTLAELEELNSAWGGAAFDVDVVSETTGIGWTEP